MEGNPAGDQIYRRSKIAARVRNINIVLLLLVLVGIITVSMVMVSNVTSRASKDLAFFYSLEAVNVFTSFTSQDLALVRKVASSSAVTSWFADETNDIKRTLAFTEMMDYKGLLGNAELYFVINDSLNEFSITTGSLEEFVPFDVIDPEDPYNSWFFDLINSDRTYAFNIDLDKVTNQWRLWINHKVVSHGEVVGVFCTGLKVNSVLHSMFDRYNENHVTGFVIDRNGLIQMDSNLNEYSDEVQTRYIYDVTNNYEFISFLSSYLNGIDGYFDAGVQPEVVKMSTGQYSYASVAPLPNSDWTVVTFFNSNALFSTTTLLPLVIMLMSVFIVYAFASSAISRRFVFVPLNNLTVSVAEADEKESEIVGDDRDDEIGDLARTIKEGWHRIGDAHRRAMLMLDATPLACRLMKRLSPGVFELVECNEESVKLFGFKNKLEFMERYFEIYPELQPDGENSIEKGRDYFEKAYLEGLCEAEFMFKTTDGIPIPTEVTLVRVEYDDDFVIAGYTRDMREHVQMLDDIEKRDSLLNVINKVAVRMLTAANEDNFEDSLLEGLKLIGESLDADCVQFWPNETRDDVLHFVLKYKWLSDIGREAPDVPIGTALPYPESWIQLFSHGSCINGPISALPKEDQDLLGPLELKSTITLPLFYEDKFWGVFCVDDCVDERYYTEGEIGILNSAALMLVNAIKRNEQAAEIREAHMRTQLLLDTTPLAVNLWDENVNLFDCNEESIRLFKIKDKEEYFARFDDLSPKYQPDGSSSREMAVLHVSKALRDGKCTFEWMHQTVDGTPIPADVTLVRVAYGDRFAVAGYVRDLREYKKMMQDIHDSSVKLEAALTETQKANSAKSDFLASMSHEMRTPLNAIIGLSGLSLESENLDKETFLNLEKINGSGEMLLSIVNDILDISKIEAGKMELVEVDYDVPSVINDTVTQNLFRIGEKPIKLVLDIEEDVFSRLNGDELRIKQIMNNLLSNAIKYTDEGMVELSVKCEREDEIVWVTIRIKDTGKGIRPENLDKLFKDYSQLDLESNRKTEGTGLGLPITKSLVEMMNGTIEVESEYGHGSTFIVRIAQKFISDVHIGDDVVKSLKNFRYKEDKRGRNSKFVRIKIPYARVLVVDDNLTNLEVAKGLMKPYGMQIDCVTGGQEAIDVIRNEEVRYNAIFMDHMMPGIDGIEATEIIRTQVDTDYAKNIPIIALTANALAGNEAMFLSKGFQAFISKPIELSKLDTVIRNWVRDKNQEKLLAETPDEFLAEDNAVELRDFEGEIPGLNIENGIERFGGDKNTYYQILRSFVPSTTELLESIKYVSEEVISDYAITVHGIKGSSRGICAYDLADLAERLELAAKAGDFEFVSANHPPFMESAFELMARMSEMIAQIFPETPKEKKEQPDKDTLAKLLEACKLFDTDEIDELIVELDSYEYESGGELVAELKDDASRYNYSEMKDKIIAQT